MKKVLFAIGVVLILGGCNNSAVVEPSTTDSILIESVKTTVDTTVNATVDTTVTNVDTTKTK